MTITPVQTVTNINLVRIKTYSVHFNIIITAHRRKNCNLINPNAKLKFTYLAQNDMNYNKCLLCNNVYSRSVKDRAINPCGCDPQIICCNKYHCPSAHKNQIVNTKIKMICNIIILNKCCFQSLAFSQSKTSVVLDRKKDRINKHVGRREPSSSTSRLKRVINTKGVRNCAIASYSRSKFVKSKSKKAGTGRHRTRVSSFEKTRTRNNNGNTAKGLEPGSGRWECLQRSALPLSRGSSYINYWLKLIMCNICRNVATKNDHYRKPFPIWRNGTQQIERSYVWSKQNAYFTTYRDSNWSQEEQQVVA